MSLSGEIEHIQSIFIDTAPIIYYIEAHPQFGPLMKEIVDAFQAGYSGLRTADAVQISAAMEVQADAFLTNDARLKKIKEIKVLVLKDHLRG